MKSVYVGLSGGVDSSVSAALLKDQGYAVTGVYMKNWTADVAGVECPWKQDLADARAVAARLDIPFKVFDFQTEYKQHVVDVMVEEYKVGRTPNPDVLCNQEIKFALFLRAALADGADAIATGHYASSKDGSLRLPIDVNKDQTYFLYRVDEAALKRTIFPLAGLTKPEVRDLATSYGLPTAAKPDSQGICFVGEVGIRQFLRQYVDTTPGPVVHATTGKVLGTHEGALFYTIGQRHGLGIGGGQPFYVTSKDIPSNTVFVTDEPEDDYLHQASLELSSLHWINDAPLPGKTYQLRTRYRAELIDATIQLVDDRAKVALSQPARAITPGQSAVVYDADHCLGGGIIC